MIKARVLFQPEGIITPNPPRAIAAPAYPPISACEEEVGRPQYHVSKSQRIAPSNPASTTYWVTWCRSTKPLPMVLATAIPSTNAATKLKKAAHTTASFGDRTRVETTVAMLFAAS